jgi:hypothetical protein
MPLYFGPVAPVCPRSSDEPAGPNTANLGLLNNTVLPPAFDLASALAAANLARSIVLALANHRTINNTFNQPSRGGAGGGAGGGGGQTVGRDKYKLTHSRWVEQTGKRVKHRYKYYAKDSNGNKNPNTWVVMERIERMVWYDRAWRSYLVWQYGNKGEGEFVR